MTQSWLRSSLPIALIYMFRMLGLFLLIPVFSVYATDLKSATPQLIGIALGGYGLSQGLLQIPFGWLSDKYGRKTIITLGLILFALGSLIGAVTHSIYGMIAARIIQGTGAIGSALMALLSDVTHEQHRTKAMAVIGVTIGLSFSLAMAFSPLIAAYHGLSGIFYFTVGLAIFGILILHFWITTPSTHTPHKVTIQSFHTTLCNPILQKLNFGIFCQHLILTATFFSTPMILQQAIIHHQLTQTWHFYLPIIFGSFICMVPIMMLTERLQKTHTTFVLAISTTIFTQLFLAFSHTTWLSFCILLFIYFVAFNLLEANLPALISKTAAAHAKGTAMGIYSSSQFLGIFAGGALAGVTYHYTNHSGIFLCNAIIASLWLLFASQRITLD
jgi:MFS family permease